MTIKNEIQTLKTLAKRYARANRLPLHKALDAMAAELGFVHWSEVAKKAKARWLPSEEEVSRAEAFARLAHQDADTKQSFIEARFARPVDEPVRQGRIGDHGFAVYEVLGDIRMEGEGWRSLGSLRSIRDSRSPRGWANGIATLAPRDFAALASSTAVRRSSAVVR